MRASRARRAGAAPHGRHSELAAGAHLQRPAGRTETEPGHGHGPRQSARPATTASEIKPGRVQPVLARCRHGHTYGQLHRALLGDSFDILARPRRRRPAAVPAELVIGTRRRSAGSRPPASVAAESSRQLDVGGRRGRRCTPPRAVRRSLSRPGPRAVWSRHASYSACRAPSSARASATAAVATGGPSGAGTSERARWRRGARGIGAAARAFMGSSPPSCPPSCPSPRSSSGSGG